jgi:hypothetical protein
MSLLWVDGFEGYGPSGDPTTLLGYRGYGTSQTNHSSITTGRITGYCISANDIYSPGFSTPSLTINPTLIAGIAFKLNNGYITIQFMDNTINGIGVTINQTSIVIKLGTTTISTTSLTLTTLTWFYAEVKVFCHATAGTVEVRLNGSTIVSLTGINTKNSYDDYNNVIYTELHYAWLDDYYICDGSGLTVNDFQGFCRVVGLLPNADTLTEQWSTSTGTDHYALVDENPPNTTDYVYSGTQGQTDLYIYPPLPAAIGPIIGLQVATQSKVFSGTGAIVEAPITSYGVTDAGTDAIVKSTTYSDMRRISITDPSTGLPWTAAGLSAAQIGIKVM